MALLIYQDITLSKLTWPLGMGTFHQPKFKECSFDYFSMIRLHELKECCPLILVSVPTKFCDCMFRCKFFKCHLIKWYVNWYEALKCFILIYLPITFIDCILCESRARTFSVYYVIEQPKVMSSAGWVLFHCSQKNFFHIQYPL